MMKYLYLAVTPDEYELPIAVADTVTELAEIVGTNRKKISEAICKNLSGKTGGMKFIKVSMEELDHE